MRTAWRLTLLASAVVLLVLPWVGASASGDGGRNGTVQVVADGSTAGSDGNITCGALDMYFSGFDAGVSAITNVKLVYLNNPLTGTVAYEYDPAGGDDLLLALNATGDGKLDIAFSALRLMPGDAHHLEILAWVVGSDVEVKGKNFWLGCSVAGPVVDPSTTSSTSSTTSSSTSSTTSSTSSTTSSTTSTSTTSTTSTTLQGGNNGGSTTTSSTSTTVQGGNNDGSTTTSSTSTTVVDTTGASTPDQPAVVEEETTPVPASGDSLLTSAADDVTAPAPVTVNEVVAPESPAAPTADSSTSSGRPAEVAPSMILRPVAPEVYLATTGAQITGVAKLGGSLIALGAALLLFVRLARRGEHFA